MEVQRKSECVKVIVRCRPMDLKEIQAGHENCVFVDESKGTIEITNPKSRSENESRVFTFDSVYGPESKQMDLYKNSFMDLIQSVLYGFNGTIFAYGQTGTGKTYTIQGSKENEELRGVIPNSFDHIFGHISHSKNAQYLVRASYLEIYKEDICDLLQKDGGKHLELKETPDKGVYVKDLSTVLTKDIGEIEKTMNFGNKNRSVGATNMNEYSSRSHAIFIITIECCEPGVDGQNHIRVGKLNLVDLAGSERQSKTLSEGERLKEATKINLSLSTLGNVISALVDQKSTHIPYRDSKLTRLLQDSLGGNSKTVMVANIGPATYNYDETVNTLRYANRAKNIKNTPKINEDPKDALLREYQNEIENLKQMLNNRGQMFGQIPSKYSRIDQEGDAVSSDSESECDHAAAREAYLQEQRKMLATEKERILNDQNMLAEEKSSLLVETKSREKALQKELTQLHQLEERLRSMESKLLGGGHSIVERTRRQEAALAAQRAKLAEQRRKENEMVARMEAERDSIANLHEGFTSLRQEVDVYTARLKKLSDKLQHVKKEIVKTRELNIAERQAHEQVQEALTSKLKYCNLILDNFVSPEERKSVEKRAIYDENSESWSLSSILPDSLVDTSVDSNPTLGNTKSSNEHQIPASRKVHHITQFAQLASKLSSNPRYHIENILKLELDLPSRSTMDYEPPQLAPQVVAVLEAALQDEDDLELDGSPSVFKVKSSARRRKEKRTKAPLKTNKLDFPESRGLVPK